ncbi:MAG: DUF4430 domain-containing protein [Candidatus Kerfeldbacteria bacterium]|nr:DUF4430 domain-containing protein [Candidatus Kerfeldbacteria bacterium]
MKNVSHFTFSVSMMGVMAFALMVIGSFGYVVEKDIVQLNADQPRLALSQVRGRVAGIAIESIGQATFVVDNGTDEPLQVSFPVLPDMTVREILNQVGLAFDLKIETVASPAGVIVRGIGDKINGMDSRYWRYAVNDKTPIFSIDEIIVRDTDTIRFYFNREVQN